MYKFVLVLVLLAVGNEALAGPALNRYYTKKDITSNNAEICGQEDKRIFHGCIEVSLFTPSTRVYFDTGNDDPGELDLFNDGNMNGSIDFVSLYIPYRFGKAEAADNFSWGPRFSVGISSAPGAAEVVVPEMEEAEMTDNIQVNSSDSPVVMVTLGLEVNYEFKESSSIGVEVGYARGFTSDEDFDDIDDSAIYVGVRLNIATLGGKK